ncbi:MAG: hypothetical protein E7006_02730 [Alphaproteobacteria bacterium]|nr:hypothetical protein [Alphaproteobacteria bacterium]
MKNWKNILFKVLSVAIVTMVVVPVWAADDGCDNDDNNMITPELALCSTHAYNVGVIENPSDSGDRAFMQEIIAMKTTLITQQMFRQYEQMESMLNRLKTQLEKAVLTNDLKVASGNTDDEEDIKSSGYRATDGTYVVCAQNCLNKYQMAEALDCYEKNLACVQQQSANGENITSELKKQLWADWKQLSNLKVADGSGPCGLSKDVEEVKDAKELKSKKFKALLNDMRGCLRNKYSDYQNGQLKLKAGIK